MKIHFEDLIRLHLVSPICKLLSVLGALGAVLCFKFSKVSGLVYFLYISALVYFLYRK